MVTMRGLIKIEATGSGSGGLFDSLIGINDFLAETAPYATGLTNWFKGKQTDFDEQEDMRNNQQFATYLKGGYLLYADNLEVIFHQAETEGFRGPGGNNEVTTNKDPFREIKWQTTISPRDKDLPVGPTDALRNGSGLFDILTQSVQYLADKAMGIAEIKAYYKKRAEFLRDLDQVEVKVSSTMFKPLIGYIVASKYTMQAGAPEAVYDISVKESMENISASSASTQRGIAIEPGVGFG